MCKMVHNILYATTSRCDIPGVRGNGQDAFNVVRNGYGGGSEASVRSLLAENTPAFCRIAEAHNLS